MSDKNIKDFKGTKIIFFNYIGKESVHAISNMHINKGFNTISSVENYDMIAEPLSRQISSALSQPLPNHEFN